MIGDTDRREQWLRASQDITGALLSGDDPRAALRVVAERARLLASAPIAIIAVPDPDNAANLIFDVVDGIGMGATNISGLSVPISETGSGHVYLSGRSQIFSQYGRHVVERMKGASITQFPVGVTLLDSSVAVPLSFADEVLGVLMLVRFKGEPVFTNVELELAESFAMHAAVAIEFGRAAEARRMLAVFEDRDRIARDLHDLVIQRLFAIGLGLEGMSQLVDAKTAEPLTGFVKQLDETIREVRRTIFSLQDEPDGQTSLRTEMLRCVREVTAALGFEPRVAFDGPLDSLVPDVVRPDLLATLREALSNAARHARAGSVEVDVRVDRDGSKLTLTVTDDGVGPPAESTRRSGLANLAGRAERWHGAFTFRPGDERGAVLDWTVQLPRESHV